MLNQHTHSPQHDEQGPLVDHPLAQLSFSGPESDVSSKQTTDSGPKKTTDEKEPLASTENQQESTTETSNTTSRGGIRMRILNHLLQKAQTSGFYRYVLNKVLSYTIPFNKPHGISIQDISQEKLVVALPFKRKNFNHLNGLHACALATVSEFSSGVLLLNHLDPGKYRLIMESLEMKYHKQGRTTVQATAHLPKERVQQEILKPLKEGSVARISMNAEVYDEQGVHICTATTRWHIKEWKKTSA